MEWFKSEMIDGLTKLLSLSLDRTPAADSVQITAGTWINATTAGRSWDQSRDPPRIRAAFETLAATRETWPAPRHFLEALPAVEQKAIGYEVKPLSPEAAEARLSEIRRLLAEPVHDFVPAPEPKPEREQSLAELETYLKTHYDGKRKAAGDV